MKSYENIIATFATKMRGSNGGIIHTGFFPSYAGGSRYEFDGVYCTKTDGWQQYDTTQDAWYFGVWVNVKEQAIVCYAEGDVTISVYPKLEDFRTALKRLEDIYGEPPPAFIAIDPDKGTMTKHYGRRPTI